MKQYYLLVMFYFHIACIFIYLCVVFRYRKKAAPEPSLPQAGANALSEVALVRYVMPDNEAEGVEYIRNNACICVKVTIKQKRCCDKKWQTNLLVFNRLRPGEEIELGYAGHGISDNSLISAEHTIVTAEYL
ncbi:hypothetical protein [Chitinophaga vietnamensis]|uniref:hypothetical protein n=1 Tax=Chitinophaga vietnamensis TaxID=2593957 RepID=UPI001178A0E0|nr:hypothetical protein [Chitinophaga vietnamensis]